jgi:flagellar protein FliO/FliZ
MIELVLRIGLALLVVLGLMWMLTRLARGPAARGGRAVVLLGRQQLTRVSAVAVVRVADRALVLGVTDQQVSLLVETDLAAVTDLAAGTAATAPAGVPTAPTGVPTSITTAATGSLLSPATWRQTVDFFRDRTVRRS